MKTEEGKTNCESFMKTLKDREKEMIQGMPPMPPVPPLPPSTQNQPK